MRPAISWRGQQFPRRYGRHRPYVRSPSLIPSIPLPDHRPLIHREMSRRCLVDPKAELMRTLRISEENSGGIFVKIERLGSFLWKFGTIVNPARTSPPHGRRLPR